MQALSRRALAAACGLAFLAGLVDGIAFVLLGGYFVSFMSGNTTRGSVDVLSGGALIAVPLVTAFVAGVIAATALRRTSRTWRRSLSLGFVALLLLAAATSISFGAPPLVTGVLMAVGMGALNTVFAGNGESTFGITYMTGALVKLGQGVVAAFTGGSRTGWIRYLLMWCSIAIGAFAGATILTGAGAAAATWVAAGLATLAAVAEPIRTAARLRS